MATAFERLLQRHFQAANPGVCITTEDERKTQHRALASDDPLGPTPDLTFDPPICINGRAICWIDAKFMYGCFETRRKRWQPESKMRAAAQKYTSVFGTGAFVFANGFCREIEGWLGGEALLLDASPLAAEMQQLHAAIEEARAGDASALVQATLCADQRAESPAMEKLCGAVDSLSVTEAAPPAAAPAAPVAPVAPVASPKPEPPPDGLVDLPPESGWVFLGVVHRHPRPGSVRTAHVYARGGEVGVLRRYTKSRSRIYPLSKDDEMFELAEGRRRARACAESPA